MHGLEVDMVLETALEYHGSPRQRGGQVERTCIVLLQSELDIAFGFLRLANAEAGSGNAAHADELIARAGDSYKAVLNGLATVSLEFEEERLVLREKVRLLQDAIYAVARRRQQDVRLH
jgi:hypothetical protein